MNKRRDELTSAEEREKKHTWLLLSRSVVRNANLNSDALRLRMVMLLQERLRPCGGRTVPKRHEFEQKKKKKR